MKVYNQPAMPVAPPAHGNTPGNQSMADQAATFQAAVSKPMGQPKVAAEQAPAVSSGPNRTVASPTTQTNSTADSNHGFAHQVIPEGMTHGINRDGFVHVHRAPGGKLPWDGKGLNSAFIESKKASFMPDASGMIGDKPAPGLEEFAALQKEPGGRGLYRGYRDYLDTHYQGGYDQWRQDFEMLRRNVLLGENNLVAIQTPGSNTTAT